MKHIFSHQNRAMLAELVRTDFKIRYQGSILGYAWSLLRPLLLFLILYVVFVQFLHVGKGSNINNYAIYLLLGIVVWNFFTEMTNQSLTAIVDQGDLIRKIRIPRWIIILSSSLSAVISLGLNLIVVFVFMLFVKADFLSTSLLLPLILLEIYLLALGVSLILSALYVKYRDIRYIWEVLIQLGFYLTPILYPITLITNDTAAKLLLINPVAQSIQDTRYLVVSHNTLTTAKIFDQGPYMFIPYVLTLLILLGGLWFFRKKSSTFAENV